MVSVIVRGFDFLRTSILPVEANAILIVHSNAELTEALTLQALQSVAGRTPEFVESGNEVESVQLSASDGPEANRARPACCLGVVASEHVLGTGICEGNYHGYRYNGRCYRREQVAAALSPSPETPPARTPAPRARHRNRSRGWAAITQRPSPSNDSAVREAEPALRLTPPPTPSARAWRQPPAPRSRSSPHRTPARHPSPAPGSR